MARSIGKENTEARRAEEDQLVAEYTDGQPESEDAAVAEVTDAESADAEAGPAQEEYAAGKPDWQEKAPQPKKKRKVWVPILVVVLLAVAGIFSYLYFSGDTILAASDDATVIQDNGTFYQGVSILGVDLSGKTMEEARPLVEAEAKKLVEGTSSSYSVEGATYPLTYEELGVSVDVEETLTSAIMYGREGGFFERAQAIESAQSNGAPIDMPISYDQQSIMRALIRNDENLDIAPVDATVEMKKVSVEENKVTDMEITFTESKIGRGIDKEALSKKVFNEVNAGNFETKEADIQDLQPKVTEEDLKQLYTERGVYQTEFKDSAEGRRYNIWKMADIINGVKIEPGETWSINAEAGPRTYSRGWKGAPGISEGVYKEEAGGGICQTNSTLYNAVIRAEVEIVDKTPHSWPLGYVPGGLDATISTGSPDFKIRNNYDVPIYIVARCDGDDSRTIEVAIYGPPYEDGLTRDFSSEMVKSLGYGGTVTIPDASLPAGTSQTIIGAHEGKVFQVYKHYKDANGNTVKTEDFETVTYTPKPARVRVGTGAPPAPVW